MALIGFEALYERADRRSSRVPVAAAGGNDLTVLQALQSAHARGWVEPILVGPEQEIERIGAEAEIALSAFRVVDCPADDAGARAVALVHNGEAGLLMKGRIATPSLMHAVLDPERGLRVGRAVCQVVLMEVVRDQRRFLLADTGVCIRPKAETRVEILSSLVEVAHALGSQRPAIGLMAASESVTTAMPETVEAAELQRRNERGEFGECVLQGPLSFDLAYAAEAGEKKRVKGTVIGAADAMLFPDLLSANLTVKAIMYTADCRFGGVLGGTIVPVVFMSRADSPATRLNSLALALALLEYRSGR
jgi:phosphotransacetylase